MKIINLLSLVTAFTLTSTSLFASSPCDAPKSAQAKDLCGYLSRHTSTLSTLEKLIDRRLSASEKEAFQKDQAQWSTQIDSQINGKGAASTTLQNKLASEYAQRIQSLSKAHADELKTELFNQLKQPAKNKATISNIFFFLASNDFKNPFPTPANLAMADSVIAMGNDEFLAAHYTMFGANQGNWVPYLINATSKSITQLTWEICDQDAIKPGSLAGEDPGICGFPKYNSGKKEITNFCSYGASGTCGLETTYIISSNELKVSSARIKENCDFKPFDQGAKPTCKK